MSKREGIISFFEKNPGVHPLKRLVELGAYRNLVRTMTEELILEEVSRGHYQLAGYEPENYFDLREVSSIIPNSVFCLISALYFHNIGTQIPRQYHIAIPSTQAATIRKDYPVKTYFFSEKPYKAGIEIHDGIKVYSIAKTVADCFKYRNKIGLDVAMEALKYSISNKRTTIAEIFEMAEVCRVKNVMMPYVQGYIS